MSDEGRLVAGRYRIVGRVGTGAMGAVWQAQDEVLHRTVAIKQLLLQPGLDPHEAEDARQRTMREGRIAARLHHPHAITVFDVVTDDNGQPCLIMEYLKSKSLAGLLQEEKTLPPLEVAAIGLQVAAALKEAHAVGIVHRDIKPGNILLAGSGMVKITDFGISRATDDVTVTKTGMIAGTPAYLAPEVAIGGEPGPEADIFSLGSTLYAACEGQPPFGLSENTLSLLHAVAAGQINPPRQSGPLASVLAVLLHPEVQHRPTAEEAEELLAAVARGETPLGGPADETVMNPAAMGGAALGGAALGAGAAGAAMGAQGDNLPAAHSGSLGDQPGQGTAYYDDDPYAADAAYPEDDYDDYRGASGAEATRAVPAGGFAGDGYPDDGYPNDGYDDGYDYDDGQYAGPPPEEEKRGGWKKPALIGGIVLVALAGFGIWVFGSSGGGNADQPPPPPPPSSSAEPLPPPAPPTSESETPTTTETTTEKSTTKSKSSTKERPTTTTTEKSTSSEKPTSSEDPPSSSDQPTTQPQPTLPTGQPTGNQ